MLEFYVDVENNLGVKQGAGPLTSVQTWTYTARMDAAGDFSCTFAATDPVADEVVVKCVLRAWANLNGVWTEVGAGIVDNIERRVRPDGTVIMTASGQDLIRELTYRSVKNLALENSGAPVAHSVAVAAVAAYAPSGWTITADSSPAWNSIYGRFNGESVLAALLSVADKSRNHFTRGTGRSVEFTSTFSDSGIRAIQAGPDDLVTETCAIANLSVRHESYDLLTRIYPRGSGNGDVQLTLRNTTRGTTNSVPSGYTLSEVNNYLQHDAGFATYGLIESWLDYREIGPVSNSNADLQAAADMLFDVTLRELQRRNEEAAASYYDIHLAQCSTLLRPMQTMRLVYQDAESGLDVDTDLNILEATWSVDVTGVQTTSVIVSNVDRWPQSDVDAIVNSMTQGHVYQALPQLNANSYVTAYTKNLDKTPTQDNYAQFRFRFGEEVVQLQQVLFEFQLLPFESTVRAVSSSTTTSTSGGGTTVSSTSGGGTTATSTSGGGTTATSTAGGGTTVSSTAGGGTTVSSTSGGGTTVSSTSGGSHSHSITILNHDHDVTIGNHTHSVTTSNHSHNVTLSGHTHSVTTSNHSHDVTLSGHTHSVTIGSHDHGIPVYRLAAGDATNRALYHQGSSNLIGVIVSGSGTYDVTSSESGGGTTVTSASGGGTTATSTSGGGQTVTSASGGGTTATSTEGGGQTITSASGGGTTATSTEGGGTTATSTNFDAHSHDVTVANHSHSVTVANHSHSVTVANHDHDVTISNHDHSVTIANHSHDVTIANHSHDVTPTINTEYGIFREVAGNTYGIADLEYRINSLAWQNLDTATSLPGDWYELDLTSQLVSTSIIGRPNQANNVLEIRAKTAGKTVTVDAQLTVRNIIQAIAYA
jgi:hypothetical protein